MQLFDYHVPVDLVNDGLAVDTATVLLTASFDKSIRVWYLCPLFHIFYLAIAFIKELIKEDANEINWILPVGPIKKL